ERNHPPPLPLPGWGRSHRRPATECPAIAPYAGAAGWIPGARAWSSRPGGEHPANPQRRDISTARLQACDAPFFRLKYALVTCRLLAMCSPPLDRGRTWSTCTFRSKGSSLATHSASFCSQSIASWYTARIAGSFSAPPARIRALRMRCALALFARCAGSCCRWLRYARCCSELAAYQAALAALLTDCSLRLALLHSVHRESWRVLALPCFVVYE